MGSEKMIPIHGFLRLVSKNKSQWSQALTWYKDPEILFYADGVTDCIYDVSRIEMMYEYFSKIGELYFIEIKEKEHWKVIGDIAISPINIPITIGDKSYWGKGIGTEVLQVALERARTLGYYSVQVEIHNYNIKSQALYQKLGFMKIGADKINQYFYYVFNALPENRYSLKVLEEDDYRFAYKVKEKTLRPYIESLWGWNELKQRRLIKDSLGKEGNYMIYYDEKPVGIVELSFFSKTVEVVHLGILPEYQSKGIGRSIIRDIIKFYKSQDYTIEIGCLKNNTRARKLYEGLGFKYSEDATGYFIYEF